MSFILSTVMFLSLIIPLRYKMNLILVEKIFILIIRIVTVIKSLIDSLNIGKILNISRFFLMK